VEWIYEPQDTDEWQTFANNVMNHRDPPKALIVLGGSATGRLPRYRPAVAQRVGTGIALLFHDRGTRRG